MTTRACSRSCSSAAAAIVAGFCLLAGSSVAATITIRPPTKPARSVERVRLTVPHTSGEQLDLALPFNWTLRRHDQATLPPGVERVLVLAPSYDENAEVRVHFWREPAPKLGDAGLLRTRHEEEALAYVAGSLERRVETQELKIAGGRGVIATFTDAKRVGLPAERGTFKTVSIATIWLAPGMLVTGELRCDDVKRAEFYIGRALLESLRVLEPGAPPARKSGPKTK